MEKKLEDDVQYGAPTGIDILNSIAYANMQVSKMKCQDPEIKAKICGKGNPECIQWVEDPSVRTFSIPRNYTNQPCTQNSDCKDGNECIPDPNNPSKLVCGYAPTDVASGHCVISDPKTCVGYSVLPYTCNKDGCTSKSEDEMKGNAYLEWHEDASNKFGGRCVLGNYLLRQWAENPQSRCPKDPDTGSYPSECRRGADTPGVTDPELVLFYDRNKSQVYLTHDYCGHFKMTYNKGNLHCTTDADCTLPDNYCSITERGAWCTGPDAACHYTKAEKAAFFFIGKTIYYLFRQGLIHGCDSASKEFYTPKESFKQESDEFAEKFEDFLNSDDMLGNFLKKVEQSYNKVPEEVVALADDKYVKDKEVIGANFGGDGINLYYIEWKNTIPKVGFLASEVSKKYPSLVMTLDGKKVISITRDDAKKDKWIKRMYYTLGTKGWLTDTIANLVKNVKI